MKRPSYQPDERINPGTKRRRGRRLGEAAPRPPQPGQRAGGSWVALWLRVPHSTPPLGQPRWSRAVSRVSCPGLGRLSTRRVTQRVGLGAPVARTAWLWVLGGSPLPAPGRRRETCLHARLHPAMSSAAPAPAPRCGLALAFGGAEGKALFGGEPSSPGHPGRALTLRNLVFPPAQLTDGRFAGGDVGCE